MVILLVGAAVFALLGCGSAGFLMAWALWNER